MGEEEEVKEPAKEEVKEPEKIPEPKTMITEANAAAERQEKANVVLDALIKRQEALAVEATLGGKADVQVAKQEESPEEYAKKVMANDIETKTP